MDAARAGPTGTMRVATWNIHGAIGSDGRYAPARVVDVLKEIDAVVKCAGFPERELMAATARP